MWDVMLLLLWAVLQAGPRDGRCPGHAHWRCGRPESEACVGGGWLSEVLVHLLFLTSVTPQHLCRSRGPLPVGQLWPRSAHFRLSAMCLGFGRPVHSSLTLVLKMMVNAKYLSYSQAFSFSPALRPLNLSRNRFCVFLSPPCASSGWLAAGRLRNTRLNADFMIEPPCKASYGRGGGFVNDA